MRRCIAESLRFDRQTRITQSRSRFSFQLNKRLRQTLIPPDAHRAHVRNEITIRKEEFCRENLRTDFQTLIQIGLIAIRDTEISIAKVMFQLVGHRENHRIARQSLRQHHRRPKIIVDERAAQMSEPVGPLVNFDSVTIVDFQQIAGEDAW